jgi:hypothetical protein
VLTLPADTTELGGVDILVNNAADPAGPGTPRALADLVDADLLVAVHAKVAGRAEQEPRRRAGPVRHQRDRRASRDDRDRTHPGGADRLSRHAVQHRPGRDRRRGGGHRRVSHLTAQRRRQRDTITAGGGTPGVIYY